MAVNVFELMATLGVDTSEYEKGLGNAQSMASSFGSGVASACKIGAAAIVAVGTAAVGAGTALVDATGDVAAYGDNIDKMSQKIGISAEAYQEWDAVLQHCGASVDSLQPSMKTLATQAEKGNEAFQQLGISEEEVANLSQEDLFARVVSGLQDMEEGTERTYIASQLLGRGATELGALFNLSAEETQGMIDTVHELGGVMSDEAVKAAVKYQDTLQDMTTALDGLKRNLMSDFMPSITTVMEGLTAIFTGDFDAGIEQMSAGIQDVVANLTEALPQALEVGTSIIGAIAQSIMDNIPTVFPALLDLVENVGGKIIDGLPQLISIGGQLVGTIAKSIISGLPELASTGIEIIKQVVTGIVQAIPSFIQEIQTILPEFAVIFEDLKNMLIEMLPMLLEGLQTMIPVIIQLITDMATSLSDPNNLMPFIDAALQIITAIFNGLMEAMPSLMEAVPVIIGNLVTAIVEALPMILNTGMELLLSFISGIISSLPSLLAAVPQILTTFINAIVNDLPNILKTGMSLLLEFVTGIITSLPELLSAGITLITSLLETIVGSFPDIIGAGAEMLVNLIAGLVAGIADIAVAGGEIIAEFFDSLDIGQAAQWGIDLISNFVSGIINSIGNVIDACLDIGNTIAEYLGFSEPDKGPLSNFHTFAPDMVDLFTEGIDDNLGQIEDASIDFASAMMPTMNGVPTNQNTGNGEPTGDIIIPVYIGQDRIDEILVNAEQVRNYRSGGV